MPTKRKNGKYVPCFWCGAYPPNTHPFTYTHTNIEHDPPTKQFCSRKCQDAYIFQENNRIIRTFSNVNRNNYINNFLLEKIKND